MALAALHEHERNQVCKPLDSKEDNQRPLLKIELPEETQFIIVEQAFGDSILPGLLGHTSMLKGLETHVNDKGNITIGKPGM